MVLALGPHHAKVIGNIRDAGPALVSTTVTTLAAFVPAFFAIFARIMRTPSANFAFFATLSCTESFLSSKPLEQGTFAAWKLA